MKVHFFTPPPEQRTGGLEAAIEGLRGALERAGVPVDGALPETFADPSVVHFHGLWQRDHARVASECVRRGIPYVVSPHGMLEPWAWRHKLWKKWPYFHLVEKRSLRRAAALFATAPMEAKRLREFFPKQRVVTIPLGLTGNAEPDYAGTRASLGWRADERVLLFLSRLHVKKGLDLLLHALADLSPPAAHTRLVIVGGGEESYVSSLRELAQRLGKKLPRIDWLGEIWGENRWAYFQGADLFCLPSHSENFGLAVLEASQVGTPSLTTVTTPWADYLGSDRAFICEPHEPAIRAALARFFTSESPSMSSRQQLADWTRETFAWDVLAPQYLDVYRSLA